MSNEEDKKKQVHEWRRCKEKHCRRKFYVSVGEVEYFTQKGFDLPKRCYPCRIKRREANGSHDENKQER